MTRKTYYIGLIAICLVGWSAALLISTDFLYIVNMAILGWVLFALSRSNS